MNYDPVIKTVYRVDEEFDYGPRYDGSNDVDFAILDLKHDDLEVHIVGISPCSYPRFVIEGSDWSKVKIHAQKVARLIQRKGGRLNP